MSKLRCLSLFDGVSFAAVALDRLGIDHEYTSSEIDKYALDVSYANYPHHRRLGDVQRWRNWQINWNFDLLIGGSPCFIAGTRVLTEVGYKNIEDIRVGDMVLTHTGQFQRVIRIGGSFKKTGVLRCQGFLPTECTDPHPFYTRDKQRSDPHWKPVKELTSNSYLAMPILKISENPQKLTAEDCFLVGRWLADGHLSIGKRPNRINSYRHTVVFSIGQAKTEAFAKQIKGYNYSRVRHGQGTDRVVIHSTKLVNIIQDLQCGRYSFDKHFSTQLLKLPSDLLKIVLDSYLQGDGCVCGERHRLATVSEKMALTAQLAIAKVYKKYSGIYKHVPPVTRILLGRTVTQRPTYEVVFKKNRPDGARAIIDDANSVVWYPFRSFVMGEEVKQVYNLEVENDNSYTANNYIVHNCQGFSVAGKGLNFEDPRSKLFFTFVDILNHIKKFNPNVKFVLENVPMKKEWLSAISGLLGVEPICIDAALVSAQARKRFFWCGGFNVTHLPTDRGILLRGILEVSVSSASACAFRGRVDNEQYSQRLEVRNGHKANCLTSVQKDSPVLLKSTSLFNVNPSGKGMNGVVHDIDSKSPCVTTNKGEGSKILVPVTEGSHQRILNNIAPLNGKTQTLMRCSSKGRGSNGTPLVSVWIADICRGAQAGRIYDPNGKSTSLIANGGGLGGKTGLYLLDYFEFRDDLNQIIDKKYVYVISDNKAAPLFNALNSPAFALKVPISDGVYYVRKLSPVECERLQGASDNYTSCVSNAQRYKCLGNAFNIDVVAHILSFI